MTTATVTRRVGDATVTRVEESFGPSFDPFNLLPDFEAGALDQHRDWLVPDHFDVASGLLVASFHSWVIRLNGRVILVDTGGGNHKNRPGSQRFHMLDTPYLTRLAEAGLKPEDVDTVFCTHLHVDHCGWNTRLDNGRWVPTFPNARYIFSRTDLDYAMAPATQQGLNAGVLEDSIAPIIDAGLAQTIEPGYELTDGLVVEAAPGHTPGHVALDLSSAGARALFFGDAMHHPIQVYRPDWSTRFCEDPVEAIRTRRRILELAVERDALVFPSHFAGPFTGKVHADGDGFRWVPT